jgi:hypothetical protein
VREILARSQKVGFPGVALLVGERTRPGHERPQSAASDPAAASGDAQARHAAGDADTEG